MKKILYPILGLSAMLATSCSMDLEPVGSILEEDAVTGITDCEMYRNGFYGQIRSLTTGSYVYNTAIQMDNFIGTLINGNRLGTLNNGTILSNDGDIEGNWSGLYGGIASVNFFLNRSAELTFETEEEQIAYDRYVAEARFTRAFFYWWLLDHFCPEYNDQNKDKLVGLALVTEYNPTSDKSTYPGRSSLADTYKFIEDDLDAALKGIEKYEEHLKKLMGVAGAVGTEARSEYTALVGPMSPYICTWTIKSLQARVALLKGDYRTARDLAEDVITRGGYTLATRDQYGAMWTSDRSNEIIFRPFASSQELGVGSTGSAWIFASEYQADYLPVPCVATPGKTTISADANGNHVIDHLYERLDIRYTTFIGERRLLVDGLLVKAPVFVKYPGNPELFQTTYNNLCNMPKPFRLSELYLISAEASCELSEEAKANARLDDLRKNRISRYHTENYTGNELRQQIRLERRRELIGEGYRMSDLRRWHEGFNRADVDYASYPSAGSITVAAGRAVVYQPNDHRYVWPIPAAELQVNPQMAGQQNEGYN